jgi:hypothetical protein
MGELVLALACGALQAAHRCSLGMRLRLGMGGVVLSAMPSHDSNTFATCMGRVAGPHLQVWAEPKSTDQLV